MRILLIEDELDLAASLRRTLETGGFDCDVAYDGLTGLEMASSHGYDLVVLDIMLPNLNGFQVCAHLRTGGNLIPILMLTAKVGEWDEAESLDTGADDYLRKPVSTVVFLAHVRALIRRSQVFPGSEMTVDGITLDPVHHVCVSGSARVDLSRREVEVLACLMAAHGSTVDKRELVASIWGDHFEGDGNIAEVYVRHLRRKLEPPFGRKVVETVHGHGYRLCLQEPL